MRDELGVKDELDAKRRARGTHKKKAMTELYLRFFFEGGGLACLRGQKKNFKQCTPPLFCPLLFFCFFFQYALSSLVDTDSC